VLPFNTAWNNGKLLSWLFYSMPMAAFQEAGMIINNATATGIRTLTIVMVLMIVFSEFLLIFCVVFVALVFRD